MFYVTKRLKPILNNSRRILISSGHISNINIYTNVRTYGLKSNRALNISSFKPFSTKDDKPEKEKDPEQKEEEKRWYRWFEWCSRYKQQ